MNRCILDGTFCARYFSLLPSCSVFALLLAIPALSIALSAQAQTPVSTTRPIPASAQTAILQVQQPPLILLNGQPERLSPGARIRDKNNMLVLSGTLVGKNLLVNYVREPLGLIHEVWILTDAEAQQPAPSASKP